MLGKGGGGIQGHGHAKQKTEVKYQRSSPHILEEHAEFCKKCDLDLDAHSAVMQVTHSRAVDVADTTKICYLQIK